MDHKTPWSAVEETVMDKSGQVPAGSVISHFLAVAVVLVSG